ncbi:hypothetical protein GXM_04893 [Nostoc sphaeroides CCNUC1]|uniref:Uncharacterized protein n=1 Tax=Nostoc sphaeroides CCNUC1 TaxID=2653204 RepID=A0A5P8W4G6_9NOSO|nr:hypothetical protein GXM_04893 [Nostoc sphaeroides CCNUC1]
MTYYFRFPGKQIYLKEIINNFDKGTPKNKLFHIQVVDC